MRQYPRKAVATILLTFVILFATLLPVKAYAGESIRIGGTGSGLGTMKLLVAAFERKNPGIGVKIMPSVGSSGAIKAVAQGALDIGLIGRPLNETELKLGLSVIEYGRTPFVFVAGRQVPVKDISTRELINIYKGEQRTWPNGERIRVVLRPATDVDTTLARTISPEMSAALDMALAREGMVIAMTNQECHEVIERTPGSLGFSSLTQVMTERQHVKLLSYNGVVPSTGSLARGAYPLVKTLSLVIRPEPPSAIRRFIDFVRSAEGRRILEQTGNVPLKMTIR